MASYQQKLNQAKQKLELAQYYLSLQPLCQDYIEQEREALLEVEKWSNVEEQVLTQKSRATWIQYGDANTKYFHAQWKMRTTANTIISVHNDAGIRITEPKQVEDHFLSFLKKLMGESSHVLPCPNAEVIKKGACLSRQQELELIKTVTVEEIIDVIKSMPTDKAPGVDGFPIEFFNQQWEEVKDDVITDVLDFFQPGKLHKAINCTVITLIPKVTNPTQGYNRKGISARCVLKVDLRKAYYTLDWYFLKRMPIELDFFIEWIMECITTVTYSLTLNGGLTKPFRGQRGTRQGDPMSPYLFVADLPSIRLLQQAFMKFSKASGLQANPDKKSYWAQVFLLPKKILKMIEAICRTFLWTGQAEISRRALVAWDKICLPQTMRGLNVINLYNWNKAAVEKYLWAITKKKDCLWIRWIHSYYIKNQIIDTMSIPKNAAWVVRKIIELRKLILELPTMQGDLHSRLITLQSTDRRFSIKKLYKLQTPQVQKVYWKCVILQPHIYPRHKFNLWLAIQGRLPTVERLQKMGIQVPSTCVFCVLADEHFEHLFFDCTYTKTIWQRLLNWLGVQGR
ncbi:PREDICTED: uncharacterized protein LOC109224132 [Nicotiana attenuata]|uniref:uncharacterized protein LOC109224132 n=1 Tax=Nicotiana attenuata TaxID=49451 RepID=UPI0009053A0F|nr:PREDICTED: uncharacterized protein LOC109224132 [Nicotiana attenuata]